MSSITVFVAGGNSNTGAATIQSLLKAHPNVTIKAGVREVKRGQEKFPNADAKRLSFAEHDVKDGKLSAAAQADLKGVDTLVLVPPQVYQDRIGVTNAYIAAAKAGGVKHIVFMSTPIATSEKLLLGKDLNANEKALKASGIPTTYLHLVMFYENQWGNKDSLSGANSGAFYYPSKGNVPIQGVAVVDIGEAAANVVSQGPKAHGNKTYHIGGPALSWDGMAGVYTRVLGKPVKYVGVPDEAALKSMLDMKFPEVMAKGLVELHRHFEQGLQENTQDLQNLLDGKRKPTTFEEWLTPIAPAFAPANLKVFVAGGASNTGSATIKSLLAHHPTVTIKAGVRDEKKAADKFPGADGKRLTFVVHDVKEGKLSEAAQNDLKGIDALVLVPPQAYQDRVGVTDAYVAAAKAAGVKHIVFMSTPIAKESNMILGKDLFANEALLKASGIPTTYLHLVMFYENTFGNVETIKGHGAFYYPAKANVPIPGVAVGDIGEAAANVLAGRAESHGNKTYWIAGPSLTWDQVAAVETRALGKPVKFVTVPDDAAKKAMAGMGFPEVMCNGLVELHHWMENSKEPENTADLQSLLNGQRKPTTFAQWFAPVSGGFGPVERTVFVAGASGNTGAATVQALLKHYPTVHIKAGVRDAKKAESKLGASDAKRITYVQHDVKNGVLAVGKTAADNGAELKGVDTLVIVLPQVTLDRHGFVSTYAAAAKASGSVKHIVFLTAALKEPMILAKHFNSIELALKATAIPTTYLQLGQFFENLWGAQSTIKSQGAFYYPAKGNVPTQGLSCADIGEAAAAAAVQGPAAHGNKVYWLGGAAVTWDAVAATFTKVLGKPVKFVQVPDDAAFKAMTGAGMPEVLVKGLVELFHVLDTGLPTSEADLTALLGRKPQTYEEWLTPIAAAFK